MKWNRIQTAAKTKGVLVFAMDQSQTAVLTEPGPWGSAFDGYCIGLAANWISLAYQGKNFPIDGSLACDNPPWQATESQNLSDAMRSADDAVPWKAAVGPFQMTLSDGLRGSRATKPTATFLWAMLSQAYGCYGVTLRREGGAHAIAMRHGKDNRYHLFDPNYFHVVTKSPDAFRSFVRWYLSETGYDARYTKSTYVVGIRPPIAA